MADEVLSQSEIDKLLSALSDGTVSAEEVSGRARRCGEGHVDVDGGVVLHIYFKYHSFVPDKSL